MLKDIDKHTSAHRGSVDAADYFDRLTALIYRPASRELYHELYSLLRQLCEDNSGDRVFSNFFSQLGWLCDSHDVPRDMALAVQDLRRRAHDTGDVGRQDVLQDIRLAADFVGRIYDVALPAELSSLAPADYRLRPADRIVYEYKTLRVRVKAVGEGCLTVEADGVDGVDGKTPLTLLNGGMLMGTCWQVILNVPEYGCDRSYLADMVHEGSTLSLLDARIKEGGEVVPRWIIYEPDCLLSPSELAAIFELNAALPDNYFLKMLQPRESNYYTLLGLASGQMLDDLVFQHAPGEATYADSVRKVFCRYPLDFALVMADEETASRFHREARAQFANIKQLVETQLDMVYGFELDQALLEPSLVCPAVGLAGRIDYMQTDGRRLIEQKSGKRDEYRATHKEPHFVQMMLYQLMIEYTMGVPRSECNAYLLYSHYSDGLMMERPYIALLEQAIELRNRVVAMQERFAEGGRAADYFLGLSSDYFRQRNISDVLWNNHIRPRIDHLLAPFADGNVSSTAKAFFFRYYEFLAKEQWLGRIGNGQGAHGYADLWNNPALVRMENGDMYAGLRVLRIENSGSDDGADIITFRIGEEQRNIPTNFRLGDAVQIYSYAEGDTDPNVARQFTLRGRLAALSDGEVQVQLSNVQRNTGVLERDDKVFALEHDRVEAGYAVLTSGLYSLLTAPPELQNRFLLRQVREVRKGVGLLGDYGNFSELVARAMAANDLFLVIGPPGSGKTSCALRYMVEEHLRRHDGGKLLLMAYTNRAVDELCAMLEGIIAETPDLLSDYLRMGSSISAAQTFRQRMMHSRVGHEVNNVAEVRRLLDSVRIVVGTTTTLAQRVQVLRQMHFTAAFVDEASQILEPYILPFFTMGTVDKFVLVGDQKQLPAVVMQSVDDAAIHDEELISLGYDNCANSVFHRMLHRLMTLGRADLYMQIQTQGRMHPQLYGFVNESFYRGQLRSVPLVHQQRSLAQVYTPLSDDALPLRHALATERVFFIDCLPADDGVNDKINSAEADKVTEVLSEFSALYAANGRQLRAGDVGIIVPYRNQIGMIRAKMAECGLTHLLDVSIDTVERYQGSQRDIIIYSFTVRHPSQLRFLTSSTYMEDDGDGAYAVDRKLNVALTRAREQMVLVGNAPLLRRNAIFSKMLEQIPVITY